MELALLEKNVCNTCACVLEVPPVRPELLDNNALAVEAFPVKLAVIVPALKLPLESLFTIVEAVLLFVAVIQVGVPVPALCNNWPEDPAAVLP